MPEVGAILVVPTSNPGLQDKAKFLLYLIVSFPEINAESEIEIGHITINGLLIVSIEIVYNPVSLSKA